MLGTYERADLEGYCWPYSVAVGTVLQVFVSCRSDYSFRIVRLLERGVSAGYVVSLGEVQTGYWHDESKLANPDAPWEGCNWPVSFAILAPEEPGLYAVELYSDGLRNFLIPFVVRPESKRKSTEVAVLCHTNTWAAYNSWGGLSNYSEAAKNDASTVRKMLVRLGLRRPNPQAFPVEDWSTHFYSNRQMASGEYWLHSFLEQSNVRFDTYSDYDFHRGVVNFDEYKVIFLNIHPEYWTQEMRDRLDGFSQSGGSIMYLGANAIWERVSFSEDDSMLIFREGNEWPRICSCFDGKGLNEIGDQAPHQILGLNSSWAWAVPAPGAPFTLDPGSYYVKGIVLPPDNCVGIEGRNRCVPAECACGKQDQCIPGAALGWEHDSFDWSLYPGQFNVVGWGSTGGNITSMIVFQREGRGKVFSAGSMNFTGSLIQDRCLRQLVLSILGKFLAD